MPDGMASVAGRTLAFELPFLLPTGNELLRMHHTVRSGWRNRIAWTVVAAVARERPRSPLPRVRVSVTRFGSRAPDADNLASSVKGLLDVLQPLSKRHPAGLGIIAGDDPAHLELRCGFVRAERRNGLRTGVLIEEVVS